MIYMDGNFNMRTTILYANYKRKKEVTCHKSPSLVEVAPGFVSGSWCQSYCYRKQMRWGCSSLYSLPLWATGGNRIRQWAKTEGTSLTEAGVWCDSDLFSSAASSHLPYSVSSVESIGVGWKMSPKSSHAWLLDHSKKCCLWRLKKLWEVRA